MDEIRKYYGDGCRPAILDIPETDPLFEYMGRRGAIALYWHVQGQIRKQGQGNCTTLSLVDLPEYAYVSNAGLCIYNTFLKALAKRGMLRLELMNGPRVQVGDNWLWRITP